MDLEGRRLVDSALTSGVHYNELVDIDPAEADFSDYDGVAQSVFNIDETAHMDLTTTAPTYQILNALNAAGLLFREGLITVPIRDNAPLLRYVGATTGRGAKVLSFEDVTCD